MFSGNVKYLMTMLTLALVVGFLASYGAHNSLEGQETFIFYTIHISLALGIILTSTVKRKKPLTPTILDTQKIKTAFFEWAATTITATVITSYFLFSKYGFNLNIILILITSISVVSLACALHLRNDLYRRLPPARNLENN